METAQITDSYLAQDKKQVAFGWKIKKKQDENDRLAGAITDYLKDEYGIELPESRQTYDILKPTLFRYEELGESEVNPLENKLDNLCKMAYSIRQNRAFYAEFQNPETKATKFRPVCFWYSRHRLDHVWNYRKSQIIRTRYYHYLSTATDDCGRNLTDHYLPVHLVLTLPHQNGVYKGKRFFARELIEAFRDMRKMPWWKEMIFAGEYGIEVKRSKEHGLHIHLHSFILQYPEYTVNKVREMIEQYWRLITGNNSTYSGIHYETLYIKEKTESGRYRKDYIKPGDGIGKYLKGVMECIKYHFKPGCLEREQTTNLAGKIVTESAYDIALIEEILANTKNLRMYSRFGKFYSEKTLNFNNLEQAEDLETDELPEELTGDAEIAESRIINPWTKKPAVRSEYEILFGKPNGFVHYSPDSPVPFEPFRMFAEMIRVPSCFSIKESIRMIATNSLPFYETVCWNSFR